MKRIKIIVTIILLAFVAANSSMNAQRGQRGLMRDSVRMNRPDTAMMNRMRMYRGQSFEGNRMYGMGHMRNFPGWRGFPQYGPMGRGYEFYRQGPGRRWMNPVPPAPFRRGGDSVFIHRMPPSLAPRSRPSPLPARCRRSDRGRYRTIRESPSAALSWPSP